VRAAILAIGALFAVASWGGCGSAATDAPPPDHPAEPPRHPRPTIQRGEASWYGGKFHGRKTASGERFDQRALTAAHRKLAFGTLVRVTNGRNGRSVVVRINDRGPWGRRGAIIDLSRAAAERIGMIRAGIVPVTVEVVREP
jgi:rare lipoprotein A